MVRYCKLIVIFLLFMLLPKSDFAQIKFYFAEKGGISEMMLNDISKLIEQDFYYYKDRVSILYKKKYQLACDRQDTVLRNRAILSCHKKIDSIEKIKLTLIKLAKEEDLADSILKNDSAVALFVLPSKRENKKFRFKKVIIPIDDYIQICDLYKYMIHFVVNKNSSDSSNDFIKNPKVFYNFSNAYKTNEIVYLKKRLHANWSDKPSELPNAIKDLSTNQTSCEGIVFFNSIPMKLLSATKNLKLINLSDKKLNKWYSQTNIPPNTYKNFNSQIQTYYFFESLYAHLDVKSSENFRKLNNLKHYIYRNQDFLKKNGHPAWKDVDFSKLE